MSASDIKTRHDADIRRLTLVGRSVGEIGYELEVSPRFIRARLPILGLVEKSAENGRARWIEARMARSSDTRVKRGGGKVGRFIIGAARRDETASRLLSVIASAPRDSSLLSDHAIACLHQIGLTLVDLECAYGLPQIAAVAAIRRAHGARP